MNQATTATHVGASTIATAALMVALTLTRVKLDDNTLSLAVILVNAAAMGMHPYVLAINARLMAWLSPKTPAPAPAAPAPVVPAAPLTTTTTTP